jgi:hypothetical protein
MIFHYKQGEGLDLINPISMSLATGENFFTLSDGDAMIRKSMKRNHIKVRNQ